MNEKLTVLVFGATGQQGGAVVKALLKEGQESDISYSILSPMQIKKQEFLILTVNMRLRRELSVSISPIPSSLQSIS
jgi:nucleoside-diphosphate-sugar epimerase